MSADHFIVYYMLSFWQICWWICYWEVLKWLWKRLGK